MMTPIRHPIGLVLAVISFSLLLVSCGPITAATMIRDAQVEIEAARSAGADKAAPFAFTSCEAFLEKAQEEEGYSDFQVAIDLAKKAIVYARAAKKQALETGGKPHEDESPTPVNVRGGAAQ